MNNPLYLIVGYGVTLAAILAYMLHLRRRERAIRRELDVHGTEV